MQSYLNLLKDVLDNGEWKHQRAKTKDGKDLRTKSISGYMFKHDMRDGFPLITTKFVSLKTVLVELEWFMRGTGNTQFLTDNKNFIWREWESDEGSVGSLYPVMFRAYPPIDENIIVKKRTIVDDTNEMVFDKKYDVIDDGGKYTGKVITTKHGLDVIVLGVCSNKVNVPKLYNIQFLDSGWIKSNVEIRRGIIKCKDNTIASCYNIGKLGNYKHKKASAFEKELRSTWDNMISRCYNPKDKSYKTHGAIGVKVCDRWLTLSSFIEDFNKIDNFINKQIYPNQYVLDKDYYGDSKLYHPKTCVWVSRVQNNKMRYDSTQYKCVNDTNIKFFSSMTELSKYFGKGVDYLTRRDTYLGWKIEKYVSDDYIVRKPIPFDQINYCINELKTNPMSRRIYINLWCPNLLPLDNNPSNNPKINRQSLAPCHLAVQFLSNGTDLDLLWNQRAAHIF